MAYALANANESPINKPFIVLWLSPGTGGLHLQSARALANFLEDSSINVKLLDGPDDIASSANPSAGDLFVVNWEKLNEEKDGKWANLMVRNGEKVNLFDMLRSATGDHLDMITVIDESHTQLQGPKTQKLMADIANIIPSIQVEMSATPNTELDPSLEDKRIHNKVYVQFDAVEDAGMVRRSAILNADLESVQSVYNDVPLEQQVLWGAWEKLEELTQRYRDVGSSVIPLLLIQYPDGAQAGPRASVVEEFLKGQGLSPNETYATWLHKNHSPDLEKINRNSSPYRALIFKHAIATGWDCPRAQVLVQFRNPTSDTFKIQTIGRIMRTPEQKHYTDDKLNVAYVYSDLPDISVEVTSTDPNVVVKDRPLKRISSRYPRGGLKLTSVFQPRQRNFDFPTIDNLKPALRYALDTDVSSLLTDSPPLPPTSRVRTDGYLDAKTLLGGQGEFSGDFVRGIHSDIYVQAEFDKILTSRIDPYLSKELSRPLIKRFLMNWFSSERGDWSETQVQYFVIDHSDAISTAINHACAQAAQLDESAAIANAQAKRQINSEWEVPESELVPSSKWEESQNKGLLFTPAYLPLGRSKPELRFEQWLGEEFTHSRIVWWWKNGTRDEKYLGVPYEHNNNDEICYPDYLVMSKTGILWVVEIKDVHDPDGEVSGKTHSKAKGLLYWAQKQTWPTRAVVAVPQDNRNGGIVVQRGDALAWKPASRDTLSINDGWTALNMNETL